MEKKPDEKLSEQEIAERERRVLNHFLSSKPELHKPLHREKAAKKAALKKIRGQAAND